MAIGARARKFALVSAGLGGSIMAWEAAVHAFGIKPYILPAPSIVMQQMLRRWDVVVDAALFTAQSMLVGFVASVVIGVALALLVAFSRKLEDLIYPVLVFLQIIPKIAIAPLFLIWIGYGMTSKVLIVFLLSFFPVLVSSISAFKSVDPEIMDLARSTGANGLRIFCMVRLPHALPTLFTGVKVAAALSATAAVVAEFVASDRGLGYRILEYTNNNNTPMTFAAILVLCVMGLLLYGAVELAERLAIPWHVSRRAADGGSSAA
ncbi:MAG: ABC transporter permease [Alphaproteobacteria bacterium]|nr:ABC transporter permease [Alphaproteobacteria bacterium]